MPYHVTSRHVMSRSVIPPHDTEHRVSCHVLSCPVPSGPVRSCPALLCDILSSSALPCPVLFYQVFLCDVLSCPVLSCPALSRPVLSCHFLNVASCPVTSRHVTSSNVVSFCLKLSRWESRRLSPRNCGCRNKEKSTRSKWPECRRIRDMPDAFTSCLTRPLLRLCVSVCVSVCLCLVLCVSVCVCVCGGGSQSLPQVEEPPHSTQDVSVMGPRTGESSQTPSKHTTYEAPGATNQEKHHVNQGTERASTPATDTTQNGLRAAKTRMPIQMNAVDHQ